MIIFAQNGFLYKINIKFLLANKELYAMFLIINLFKKLEKMLFKNM